VARVPGGERPAGAFVTLYAGDELRGCIGQIEADEPLARVVARMAVAAARDDPRFEPVTRAELGGLRLEISVLTEARPASPAEVVPGRDGVLVRRGGRQGVLLPQVATEWGLGREALLCMVCRKAGLSDRAWQDDATELLTFQAVVIGAPVT
jgi:AmmeMemoRadiSam system protein A